MIEMDAVYMTKLEALERIQTINEFTKSKLATTNDFFVVSRKEILMLTSSVQAILKKLEFLTEMIEVDYLEFIEFNRISEEEEAKIDYLEEWE